MNNIDFKKYLAIHSPGYVIEIYKDNKSEEHIYGYKTITPNKEKVASNTLYDIASLTKVFTSTLIYMAYEEGLIKLDNNIYNIDNSFINLKETTILDLLSHNKNIWTDGYLGDAKNKEEFYKTLYSAYKKSDTPTYSDTDYIILSTILEKIYHKPFDIICQEKIFNPLNMTNTTFNPDNKRCASNNYEYKNNTVIDNITPGLIHDTKARIAKELGINLGNASIFTTGSDLLTFLKTFLDCSLLKKDTIEYMLKHRNTNEENYKFLKELHHETNINIMYDKLLNDNYPDLPKTYNFMGVRYRNIIDKINDVPNNASDNSISFSGYTGPMFTIDFDKNIIVIIMCNVIHNSHLSRYVRKELTTEIMNKIFDNITL